MRRVALIVAGRLEKQLVAVDGARSHAAQGLEETIMGWLTGLEPGKGV